MSAIRLLVASQVVSALGDGLFEIALAFAVLDATGSATALGTVLAAQSLPIVALVLAGGVWADRLPRRRILVACDCARVAIQGASCAVIATGAATLPLLVALALATGTVQAFHGPAATGFTPEIVPPGALAQTNGLLQTGVSLALLAGNAAGGVLVAAVGPAAAIGADAATFAASAAMLVALRAEARPPALGAGRSGMARELGDGWRELRAHRWLWQSVLVFSALITLSIAPLQVVGPIAARRHLGGAAAWGAMGAVLVAGIAAGGLLAGRRRVRRPMVAAGTLLLATAVTPLLLATAAPLAAVLASVACEGVAYGITGPVLTAAMQARIPVDRLSRVSAWDALGSIAGMPLGLALTGPLLDRLGLDALLRVLSLVGLACATTLLALPEIRRLGAADP